MRAMKDSGIEWIGQIPKEWTTIRLRSRFSFGKGLPITKADLTESGIGVISYGQIHSKANIGTEIKPELIRYVDSKYLSTNESSLVSRGDFIFADTSEDISGCGNCVYVDVDYPVFAGYHTLILRPESEISTKYYSYLFATDAWRSQIRAQASGVKLFSITQKMLRDTLLIEPSEEEKGRIVRYLDEKCIAIDAMIAAKEKTNTLLKERRQSIIYEAVTKGLNPDAPMKDSEVFWIGEIPGHWDITRLKFYAQIRTGFTLGKRYESSEELQEYPYLRVANVQGEYTDLSNLATIQMPASEAEQYKLQPGELLMTEGGDRDKLGRGSVWYGEISDCLHQNHVFALSTSDSLNVEYLSYLTTSNVGRDYFDYTAKKTTNLASTNSSTILEFKIPLPSREEQDQIVKFLDVECGRIDNLILKNDKTIEGLKEYRQSIIYEAVTGKIEV